MQLFIRVKDGQPFEHPIFEDNFRAAFPEVNIDNLPDGFAKFVRVLPPTLGVYEKNQTVSYEFVNGMYTDVFRCEQMTAEEITAKQEAVKADWAEKGFASWSFDEALCTFVAPIAKPNDGNNYFWRESDLSWVFVPAPPKGEGWTFNVETGLWVKA